VLYPDLTSGLNGQSLSISLGTPDTLVLRGNAFPVIVAQDGANAMMAAARLSDAGGKVVAFNKEAYMQTCGDEASPATSLPCRLAVNALRWAANRTGSSSFRLAVSNNVLSSTQISAIKTAAVCLGNLVWAPGAGQQAFQTTVLIVAARKSAVSVLQQPGMNMPRLPCQPKLHCSSSTHNHLHSQDIMPSLFQNLCALL